MFLILGFPAMTCSCDQHIVGPSNEVTLSLFRHAIRSMLLTVLINAELVNTYVQLRPSRRSQALIDLIAASTTPWLASTCKMKSPGTQTASL